MVFYRDQSINLTSGEARSKMPQSLLELLQDTWQCEFSDSRDRIFAVLGMLTEGKEPVLTPNYAMSTRKTFLHFTKFLIHRDKTLDVLSHAQEKPFLCSIASWVPDWSCPKHWETLVHKQDSTRRYKTSQGLPAEVVFQHDPETLITKGKPLDTVSKVGREYQGGPDWWSILALERWEAMISALDKNASFTDILAVYPPYSGPNIFKKF